MPAQDFSVAGTLVLKLVKQEYFLLDTDLLLLNYCIVEQESSASPALTQYEDWHRILRP